MYLVYLLPLFLIVLVALAIFAPPLLAVIVFVAFLAALGLYKFSSRTSDAGSAPSDQVVAASDPGASPKRAPEGRQAADEEKDHGAWGESWPEQSR
jgi:hypothetical protein